MNTYIKNTEDRKNITKRIAEITGQKLKYTMPHYTFVGQGFTVTREGNLEVDETADMSVVETLIEEGLILAMEGEESRTDTPVDSVEQAEQTEVGTESPLEAATEVSGDRPEDTTSEQVTIEADPAAPETDALTISFPLSSHTVASIRNLVSMIYSRGHLLSKATGGGFHTTEEQVGALTDCISVDDVRNKLTDCEGIAVETDKITFTGFPATSEPDKFLSFTQLAAQINRMALKQKRTMAKEVDETNERYIFRIWLIALGMKGDEFKTARRILLAPLSGNAAFKDKGMEDRWKAKQAVKRMETATATETSVS